MHFLAAKACSILDKNQNLNLHMMNQLNLLMILVLQFMFFNVQAQLPSSRHNNMPSQSHGSQIQSSLAVVIGLLTIMFSLTFILVLYAKFCHRAASVNGSRARIQDGLPRSRSRFSGIDKTVIESLPFFRFSSLRGSRGGLECAVCLSKFEEIEILRLLPKCRHAFHINCIDLWLEKHSSCPLCRRKVNADDLSLLRDSTSLRFLWDQSELRGESNLELYIEREEDHRGSSRFSFGRSFRRSERGKNEEELPIQQSTCTDDQNDQKVFHKFNHKIIMSGVVFKNRWSNLSSSDLLFLSSEMLSDETSSRFAFMDASMEQPSGCKAMNVGEIMNIKEDIERKRVFESKFSKIKQNDSFLSPALHKASESTEISSSSSSKILNPTEKRSMSEIAVHPRFAEFNKQNSGRESYLPGNTIREEKMRRLWLPIARRTVEWFASRERLSFHTQRQSSNV